MMLPSTKWNVCKFINKWIFPLFENTLKLRNLENDKLVGFFFYKQADSKSGMIINFFIEISFLRFFVFIWKAHNTIQTFW